MNTRKKQSLVLLASILTSVSVAVAAEQTIPTPASGGFIDTESSLNVPLADWPDLGRHVKIDLTAYATPSNAIQIAFGQDTNGDEDLEPEETMLVIGVDCGEPFVREEDQGLRSRSTVEVNHHSSTSTSHFAFSFKQPSAVSKRYTHAKVTTRNMATTNAVIVAEIKRPGLVLLLR